MIFDRAARVVCWIAAFCAVIAPAVAAGFLIPRQEADPVQLLAVQRSAALASGGSYAHRRPFRMIIYGQSTSQQSWAWELMREMPQRYPFADVSGYLQAITSFNADYLIQTAEADIYPLLPDLIIFQCYGPYAPGAAWEQILRSFRTRTTADVILIGNHPQKQWELDEPVDPAEIHFDLYPYAHGPAWVNYIRNPELSRAWGLCNPDVRSVWKRFIRDNGLQTSDLLVDQVHFNQKGSDLLKAILLPYLDAKRLSPPLDPFNNARVQTHAVGDTGLQWQAGRLRLPFLGNRVDLIAGPGKGGKCRVSVDGLPPSTWPSGTGHSRSSGWKKEIYGRPAILQVGHEVPLVPEIWQLTVTNVDQKDPTKFSFLVQGSVTGPDGSGTSTDRFVSKSRRVVLETNGWNLAIIPTNSQVGALVQWNAQVRSVDVYEPRPLRGPTVETSVNLIHGLPDESHVLELVADDPRNPPPIAALRVYHPGGGMPGTEVTTGELPVLRYLQTSSAVMTVWPAAAHTTPLFARAPNEAWYPDQRPPAEMFGFSTLTTPLEEQREFFRIEREP